MTGFSNYAENKVLNHMLRGDTGGTAFTQPSLVYLSLHTADPTDTGAGAEVSGGSYARKLLTFGNATTGTASNTNTGTFSNMPTCNVTHGAIWDAVSGGNMLFAGPFGATISFNSGDSATFAAAAIAVTLD